MKKQIIVSLIFILIFLAGCQSQSENTSTSTNSATLIKVIETGQDKANENSQASQSNIVQIDMTAKI